MSRDQKLAGALIVLLVLIASTGFALWLALLVRDGAYAIDPMDANSRLRFPWRMAKLFIELGTGINIVFAGVIAIIATGTGWLTEVFHKRWQLWLVIVLCLLGLVSAIYMMVDVNEEELTQLKYYGKLFAELSDEEATRRTRAAFLAFTIELVALFSFFLGSRLGIERASPDGALRELLKKLFGEGGEK